ncbi:MAG: ABC transporter ATP-binding protein [Saccharofermentanales bacterium]|jgi:ATP-binding cassette subfamily B multidrug efflux pump
MTDQEKLNADYEKEQLESRKNFSLKRLYSYALPYWKRFLLVIALILITTGVTLIQPKLIQLMIDNQFTVLSDQTASSVEQSLAINATIKISLVYLGTLIIAFVTSYWQACLLQATGQEILRRIRQNLYNHILHLPTSFFDHHPLGSLVTRVTNDTETLNEMFTSVLSNILRNLFTLSGILVVMFLLNYKLALLILVLIPLVIFISIVFRKAIRKVYFAQRRVLAQINSKLSENISGMRTIQIFDRKNQTETEFDQVNQEYLALSRKELKYFSIYRPSIEVIQSLGIAALIWFGSKGNMEGLISFGVLYAFIDYIQRFFHPIFELSETFNLIQSAITSTSRIFHLMDEPLESAGGSLRIPKHGLKGEIEFKNVWFAYTEEEWILKDVSFKVEPGQFVAFVGATGTGKSTIMHLICRFYDIDRGQILIDGHDIKEYNLRDLREAIGVVQQDVFIYSGSIADNITLNRENVDYEAARKAAALVNADDFINKLQQRYREYVTERGSTLSAGQRQLLSFARTVAAQPSVLVLDEATANIDTETELLIQDAIRNMAQQRSMLAVAHRISTIADADNIIVLHHGRLAEQGTKDELLAQDGLFKVLYELQFRESK